MKAIEFSEQWLDKLGAGSNPNTIDLPRAVTAQDPATYGKEIVFVTSCWEPSPEELAAINATGKVWVHIMANIRQPTQPPIYISGFHPREDGYNFIEQKDIPGRIAEILWENYERQYAGIMDMFIQTASSRSKNFDADVNAMLTEWHRQADAFLALNPEFKQRHEDMLKHS